MSDTNFDQCLLDHPLSRVMTTHYVPPNSEDPDHSDARIDATRVHDHRPFGSRRARLCPAARQNLVRHQLGGRGRARRLLSGGRRRHLQDIRPRRDDRAGRPAGEQPHAAACRPHRFLHERELPAGLRRGGAEHSSGRRLGHLPEGPAGVARTSGRCGDIRGFEEAHAVRLVRGPADLLQVDAGRVRLLGKPGEALHVQPAAVPGRPEQRDAGLRHLRALRGRESGRETEDLSTRRPGLQHLLDF